MSIRFIINSQYDLFTKCVSVSMVLGIPTVQRLKQSYLVSTISSLLFSLTAEEKHDLLIVVLVAEVTHTEGKVKAEGISAALGHFINGVNSQCGAAGLSGDLKYLLINAAVIPSSLTFSLSLSLSGRCSSR